MLKTRVLTAVLLAPLVLAVSWWGNALVFSLFSAALMALVLHEWLAIVYRQQGLSQWLMPLIVAAIIAGHGLTGNISVPTIVYLAVALWALALVWLAKPQWGYSNGLIASKIKAYLGIFLTLTAGLALVSLHNHQADGRLWTVILFGLIWVADIGAYFSGRLWGRHKLAPAISPGKTIEGVLGALVFVSLYAFLVAKSLGYPVAALVAGFVAIALISMVGDLTASLIKRQGQVKDSGRWLPGHGGFLDRFDSLLAAAPFFLALVYWLGTQG
jgi:phosphatidate cytidylyltransferase